MPENGHRAAMVEAADSAALDDMLHLWLPKRRQHAGTWFAGASRQASKMGEALNTATSNTAQKRRITLIL